MKKRGDAHATVLAPGVMGNAPLIARFYAAQKCFVVGISLSRMETQ